MIIDKRRKRTHGANRPAAVELTSRTPEKRKGCGLFFEPETKAYRWVAPRER